MSTIPTVPPLLEITDGETRIWPLDLTPTLTAMGVTGPSTPVVAVVDPVTDTNVGGAVGAVALVGTVLTATIIGSALTAGKAYQIEWSVVVGGQAVMWITQLNV